MLTLSNKDVLETLRVFRQRGIKVAFLVPTGNGLSKSIMDATFDVRSFLRKSAIHDFDNQPQGPENKRLIGTTLISREHIVATKTSVYRPETKFGDPRIWIYNLSKFAAAGDLLALTKAPDGLTVINCSTTNLEQFLDASVLLTTGHTREAKVAPHSLLHQAPVPIVVRDTAFSAAFVELLKMLQGVATKGYVGTMRAGDTGVGFTLESLLGIHANSSKAPDYRGIEIKSGRARTHASGQTTVFSQVPDWQISRLKGSKDILWARGRFSSAKNRQQLFHEISAVSPNSYGLKLEMDYPFSLMHQVFISGPEKATDVSWAMEKLKSRLLEKHKETVWVTAKTRGHGTTEEFWYNHLKHTDQVDADKLPLLLETGAMTVHYTIKETSNGGAKDQGYLFKTSSKNLELLFSRVDEITL